MSAKLRLVIAAAAFPLGVFTLSGPLQHFGLVPETAMGDMSKSVIKAALGIKVMREALACGPGSGSGVSQGNNGIGNGGLDGVPGHSNFQDDTR